MHPLKGRNQRQNIRKSLEKAQVQRRKENEEDQVRIHQQTPHLTENKAKRKSQANMIVKMMHLGRRRRKRETGKAEVGANHL